MSSESHGGYADANAVTKSQSDLEYEFWSTPPANGLYPAVPNTAGLPAIPVEGQCVWQADTNEIKLWNGSAWTIIPTFANGNIRVTRPNTTDRLVEVWNGSTWSVLNYDSGWRTISSWDSAGVVTGTAFGTGWAPRTGVAGSYKLRLLNNVVHYFIEQIQATALSPSAMIFGPQPNGFGTSENNNRGDTTPSTNDIGLINTAGIGRIGGGSVAVGNIFLISGSAVGLNITPLTLPGINLSSAPA